MDTVNSLANAGNTNIHINLFYCYCYTTNILRSIEFSFSFFYFFPFPLSLNIAISTSTSYFHIRHSLSSIHCYPEHCSQCFSFPLPLDSVFLFTSAQKPHITSHLSLDVMCPMDALFLFFRFFFSSFATIASTVFSIHTLCNNIKAYLSFIMHLLASLSLSLQLPLPSFLSQLAVIVFMHSHSLIFSLSLSFFFHSFFHLTSTRYINSHSDYFSLLSLSLHPASTYDFHPFATAFSLRYFILSLSLSLLLLNLTALGVSRSMHLMHSIFICNNYYSFPLHFLCTVKSLLHHYTHVDMFFLSWLH